MPILGLEDTVRELGQRVLESAATSLLEDLRDTAPVDTGELRDSAYGPIVGDLTATIGFTAPQADYTDLGTAPHVIRAVNAPRLNFFWENGWDGARWYSFEEVHHPGQHGTGWFSDKVETEWDEYVQSAAGEVG